MLWMSATTFIQIHRPSLLIKFPENIHRHMVLQNPSFQMTVFWINTFCHVSYSFTRRCHISRSDVLRNEKTHSKDTPMDVLLLKTSCSCHWNSSSSLVTTMRRKMCPAPFHAKKEDGTYDIMGQYNCN